MKICMNEEELVNSLISDNDIIYVDYKLGKKISNIKNTGKIAWGVLIGGVLVAATAIISSKKLGKDKVLMASSIAGVAVIYIGLPSTVSLIQILIHAYKKNDGISGAKDIVLKLRNNYYIAEKDREKLTLKKTAGEKVKEVKITEIKKPEPEKNKR